MDGRIRVLIADDHPVVRNGVCRIIASQQDMEVVAEAPNGSTAIELLMQHRPDIGLIDLQMPELDGISVISEVSRRVPETKLVILSSYSTDEDVESGIRAGARAYLLKDVSASDLVTCIRDVKDGKTYIPPQVAAKLAERLTRAQLTPREMEVLRLIGGGLTNKEIANRLYLAESTVKLHVKTLFDKLGVTTRTEAMRIGIERGLIRVRP